MDEDICSGIFLAWLNIVSGSHALIVVLTSADVVQEAAEWLGSRAFERFQAAALKVRSPDVPPCLKPPTFLSMLFPFHTSYSC